MYKLNDQPVREQVTTSKELKLDLCVYIKLKTCFCLILYISIGTCPKCAKLFTLFHFCDTFLYAVDMPATEQSSLETIEKECK